MKAAVYYENGDPNVFRYEEVPDPQCGPGDILIKVAAISIEGGDTLARWRGALAARPHIVGYQAAGEIIAVGAEVTHLAAGQRVVTVDVRGSHAALRSVPARNAWPTPDALDTRAAAAIPISFATAHDGLFEFGRLKPGETVLVQAGASGVGIAAIQLAHRAGARVLATASSDARLERLMRLELGLDHGINYAGEDVAPAVKRLTGGKGADLVIDPVGGGTLQSSIAALAYRGRVSLVGAAGRSPSQVDAGALINGSRSLVGVLLAAEIATDRVRNNIHRLIDQAAQGLLKVVIDRAFPLAEAAAAHAYIESRHAVGRVLLIP
ncbi:MAG TPA: zinc-binding alcohol dehydrogenase family protein [Stellaceae bacterium]|nr:zinc-binding alcohol dehydrogenase family protein [Stellaceae bacterium]